MIDGKQVLKQVAGISLIIGLLFKGCGQADKVTTDTNIEESDAHSEAEEKVEAEENTEDIEQMEAETNTEAEVKTEAETNTEVGEQAEPGEKVENCDKIATLLYQGHGSARIITAEGKVIYIDPFMGDGYDIPADLVLMTHGHYDHTQENLITAKNEGCTVIKWSDALKDGEYKNYDLGFVNIETVEAGYNKNHDVSECVGYILTFSDGIKIYFSGDTSTTPSMSGFAEKKLDYALLCCDGVYNMDVTEASECAKMIGAKHTIPYHMEPAKDKSGFDMSVAESFDAPGKIILKPGEELVLE